MSREDEEEMRKMLIQKGGEDPGQRRHGGVVPGYGAGRTGQKNKRKGSSARDSIMKR